ncbi:hypothetical protein [Salinispora pacifica]|uniref:hypothetical protein n=1 Tax=Salinispora pacifica TaxID=351187 RepID=UPI001EE3121B|nr:hypothetical protein [Salinispora pacifica]
MAAGDALVEIRPTAGHDQDTRRSRGPTPLRSDDDLRELLLPAAADFRLVARYRPAALRLPAGKPGERSR